MVKIHNASKGLRKEYAEEMLKNFAASSSFFFASPNKTLLTSGVTETISGNSLLNLSENVAHYFDEARNSYQGYPILVGALPFDRDTECHLHAPASVQWSARSEADKKKVTQNVLGNEFNLRPVPEPHHYANGVEEALSIFRKSELEKVVLSRSLEVESTSPLDVKGILTNLIHKNPTGYVFAADVSETGDGSRSLVGASPELLLTKQGHRVISNPLAGSVPRVKDPVQDRKNAEALLESPKDLHEHALVVQSVKEALLPFCKVLKVPEKPSLVHTETMWHLSTVVEGELLSPETTSIDLCAALHPTPAVCGFPRDHAKDVISDIEDFERNYFTGSLGWCDIHGNGEWIVTIRCAEVNGDKVNLFAGAGIVEGSCPDSETRETGAKFNTMLHALGLCGNNLEGIN